MTKAKRKKVNGIKKGKEGKKEKEKITFCNRNKITDKI